MEKPEVPSNTFLRHDIQSILRAIDAGNAELAACLPIAEVAIYRAGFIAALRAVATAFNVHLESAKGSYGQVSGPEREHGFPLTSASAAEHLSGSHTDLDTSRLCSMRNWNMNSE